MTVWILAAVAVWAILILFGLALCKTSARADNTAARW